MRIIIKEKLLFFLIILLVIICQTIFSCRQVSQSYSETEDKKKIVYTMVNVCGDDKQGDAHILQFPNGSVYVIDAGGRANMRNKLVLFLKKNHIETIDKNFISHAHKDHYEGIVDVIAEGIKINTVYFNLPNKEACDREKPWGCDYDDINKMLKFIKGHGIPIETLKAGDLFVPEKNVALQVLAVFDGSNTPIGKTDINDTSVIMKLCYGKESILFTGDLNLPLSNFLVKNSNNLRADIVKVPHHGAESAASNAFFDSVSPKLALVPSPKSLWLSDRSKRIRDYFKEKNIPVLVSGIDNDIIIYLYQDRYEIVKQK